MFPSWWNECYTARRGHDLKLGVAHASPCPKSSFHPLAVRCLSPAACWYCCSPGGGDGVFWHWESFRGMWRKKEGETGHLWVPATHLMALLRLIWVLKKVMLYLMDLELLNPNDASCKRHWGFVKRKAQISQCSCNCETGFYPSSLLQNGAQGKLWSHKNESYAAQLFSNFIQRTPFQF